MLGKFVKWVKDRDYSLAMAILYIAIALTILTDRSFRAILWFAGEYNTPPALFAVAFFLGAVIMLLKPSFQWFGAALVPIGLYSVASIMWAVARQSANVPVNVAYAVMLIGVPLAYRLSLSKRVLMYRVYAIHIGLVGITILLAPARGAVQWIATSYGVSSVLLGLALCIGAIYLLLTPKLSSFVNVAWLLVFYVCSVIIYSGLTGNYTSAFVTATLLITFVFTLGRAESYFPPPVASLRWKAR